MGVEHYEIAAYGTVKAFADTLGHTEHMSLLGGTLEKEKETDKKLTDLAQHINVQAVGRFRGVRGTVQPQWSLDAFLWQLQAGLSNRK